MGEERVGMAMGSTESEEKRGWRMTMTTTTTEAKKGGAIAAPMVGVTVLQYLLQVVSMIMVGHLGQLSLSSVAIATSLTNVSGFSVLSGMAGGLETLCGQAYGAEQYQKLGIYTFTAMVSLSLVCVPISIVWSFMHKLLPLLGQDPLVCVEARKYALWLVPALFASAILKPLSRYFQTQSLISPMLLSSFSVMCLHVVTCWGLVFRLGLGLVGAAIAFSISAWVNVVVLVLYVKFSSACDRTRVPFANKQALIGVPQFFGLAVPSAVMVCLKWWACELLVLVAALLPNPKLETSVLSICLTISTLHFTVAYGLGAAASTRVSNELGGGNPEAAKVAVSVAMVLAVTEAIVVSAALFGCRNILGYAFSDDSQVVKYVAAMTPLLCVSIFMDSLQAVLSGVARGSGWQKVGAYVNLLVFYGVGVPVGALLGFVAHLRAKGLWVGIVTATVLQSFFLSLITALTNWSKQSKMARERIFESRSLDGNGTDRP